MTDTPDPSRSIPLNQLFADHSRQWRQNVYVYPVISRRSGGLSIGVNLNPDKACNFDCVYCQVDRTVPSTVRKVDMNRLAGELEHMIRIAGDGTLFEDPAFAGTPEAYRRVCDIAFSGDGEPTACPQFPEAVQLAADLRSRYDLRDLVIRVITDAAFLDRPRVAEALAVMDANHGEVWAKLDAGTEDYFRAINRPNVSLATVVANIATTARVRPVVIQSLWMNLHGEPPPAEEIDAFAGQLRSVLDGGGQIKLVQVYTIARRTAEPFVTPLSAEQLEGIAAQVRSATGLDVAVFP